MITEGHLILTNNTSLSGTPQNFTGRITSSINSKILWVESVVIEHSFYNIDKYNDRFFYVLNTPDIQSVPIIHDEYDLGTLCGELNAEFAIAVEPFTFTPTANGHVVINQGHPYDVVIRFDLMPDIAYMLGFDPIPVTILMGFFVVSPHVSKFNLIPCLYVDSNLIPASSYFGDSNIFNIIACVPVNQPFGSLIIFKQDYPRYFKINPNVNSFRIRILDDKQREVNLNGGKVIINLMYANQQLIKTLDYGKSTKIEY